MDPWRELGLRDAALDGDGHAWRELFETNADGLDAFIAWRWGGRRDGIEDVSQEVWLIAVDRLSRFEPRRGTFLNWLRGIAANVIRSRLRRERPSLRRCAEMVPTPDASDRTAGRVALTLDALPDRYEHVLRCKYLDGMSVVEIATATGQSEKAIESLLTRARQAFRDIYNAEE